MNYHPGIHSYLLRSHMTAAPAPILRNNPQQERARTTVAQLEEAAKIVLETIGRDKFSTADIAAQSGRSIGTVYRYWPNRHAVLEHIWPDRADEFLNRTTLGQPLEEEDVDAAGDTPEA